MPNEITSIIRDMSYDPHPMRRDNLDSRFCNASFRERRCLVPVTSFSEPKGKQPGIWHWFALSDERDPFAFAGIWRSYNGPASKDGDSVSPLSPVAYCRPGQSTWQCLAKPH